MSDRPQKSDCGGGSVHGTTVDVEGEGVLLRGPPGSGKSDLALRLIDEGARLVADDQTVLRRSKGALEASAPSILQRKIEVRGMGVVTLPTAKTAPSVKITLVVDLAPSHAAVARMPEHACVEVSGVMMRRLWLWPFEPSAAAKVRLAIRVKSESIEPSSTWSVKS